MPYTSSYNVDVWDALIVLDANPANSSEVSLVYSLKSYAKARHGGYEGWNREHVWPKSYGVGYSGADYTDLHSLRACDASVNSARSNLPFDEVSCDDDSACDSPAHSEAAQSTAKTSSAFQPPVVSK